MTLEALIFDVDGTLADTEEAHRRSFNDAFAVCGLPWHWNRAHYAELLKTTGGKERIAAHISALDVCAAERAGLKAGIPEIHRRKTDFYTARVRKGTIALRAGVRRLLGEARVHGLRLAIASTTSRDNIDALLTTTLGSEAPGWFEVIAAGDEVPRKKPASDIYVAVLRKLALPAHACIAFEDSGRGLFAAKTAGLCTVVTPTRWTRNDNFTGADLVLPTLGDAERPLTGAAAARVRGTVLDLATLRRLHAAGSRSPMRPRMHRGRAMRRGPGDGNAEPE
jgi:HAD superfamily hydrolase (TIGR01509 family)